jgi:hypothetical protein
LNAKFDLLLKLGNDPVEGHGRYENVWLKCGDALTTWIDAQIEKEKQ